MCSETKPYSFIISLTNLVDPIDCLDSSGTMGLFGAVHFRNLGHANQARNNHGDETRQVCKLCKFVCHFPCKMKLQTLLISLTP